MGKTDLRQLAGQPFERSEQLPRIVHQGAARQRLPLGQAVQHRIAAAQRTRRIRIGKFVAQDAVGGQTLGMQVFHPGRRPLDAGDGRTALGHAEQVAGPAPHQRRLRKETRARERGRSVRTAGEFGVAQGAARSGGGLKGLQEAVKGRYHLYWMLTLIEPILSTEINSAIEALKLMPRNGGRAPGPFRSRIASSSAGGMGLEQS